MGRVDRAGGKGAYTKGTLSVTSGQVLRVYVGGSGGWPYGGDGGYDITRPYGNSAYGGDGGGSSEVRTSTSISDRKIVAGGGGGFTWEYGSGTPSSNIGSGGTSGATGGGGSYNGGNGADFGYNSSGSIVYYGDYAIAGAAGGGGGGWDGGNGGSVSSSTRTANGGAAGSSYVGGVSSTTVTGGARSGNGYVRFTYYAAPLQPGPFVYPTAGATVYDTQEIEWGASTDADGDLAGHDIDYSSNNGSSWTRIITGTNMPYGKPFDFSTVAVSSTAKLRVRGRDAGSRVSSWRESSTFEVVHNAGPEPPIINSPSVGATLDGSGSHQFSWTFQTEFPGTTQASFSLHYRIVGSSEWEEVSGGTSESYTFSQNTLASGEYEWQVRTTDTQSMTSGWSSLRQFRILRSHASWGCLCKLDLLLFLSSAKSGFGLWPISDFCLQ